MDAQTQYEQAQAQYQQQTQQRQQALQNQAVVDAGGPQPTLGPESQNEQAGVQFASAKLALQMAPVGPEPVPPQVPQVPKPWTPFEPRPNDTEPELSEIWNRKMSRTMSTVKYGQFKDTQPEWTDVFNRQYTLTRQAKAMGQGAAVQVGSPPKPQPHQPTQPSQPSQPTQPTLPGAK